MFSFLYSEKKKMRQNAENWLEIADRVYKYRRDLLKVDQLNRLLSATDELKFLLKEKGEAKRIKASVEALEVVLRDTGGRIYPVSSMMENVEFFLVAAIVILGLRAYFVQPFKIPTNSMWPSYYGMTSEVFQPGKEPGLASKIGRMATLGATNYSVTAPVEGEVLIPTYADSTGNLHMIYSERAGRSLLVFPTTVREYTFSIGGRMVPITVPSEWAQSNFDEVLREAFFKDETNLYFALNNPALKGRPLEQSTMVVQQGNRRGEARVYWVPIGKKASPGEKILSFDILTGDLLFVDRFTYNFFPPKVGSGFVFRTGNIPELASDPVEGGDKYFIKRLVGVPGDTLEVKQPAKTVTDGGSPLISNEGQLYRNGKPIEGSDAFGKNSRKDGLYPGYVADGRLAFGQVVSVPNNSYFAMGDNSPRSKDSRFWGFVPDKDVVGRPLFIYYPLTKRWGPAK